MAEYKASKVQKKIQTLRIIFRILKLCSSKYFLLFSKAGFHILYCLKDTKLFVPFARIKV